LQIWCTNWGCRNSNFCQICHSGKTQTPIFHHNQAKADSGIQLCDSHAESCEMCHVVVCPSCISFHETEHPKPASTDHAKDGERRIALTLIALPTLPSACT